MINKNIFWSSFQKLDEWLSKNQYRGYDPYDIRGTQIFLLFSKSRYLRRLGEGIEKLAPPLFLRQIFGVRKVEYPLVYSHCAQAYLRAFKLSGDKNYLKKSHKCLDWLKSNNLGEPFDWQTKIFIPKYTLDAYNHVNVAQTFLLAYKILKEEIYLEKAKILLQELVDKLNIDDLAEDKICFSYTPLDHFHIHNINLYVASLLFKVGVLDKHVHYLDLAQKALNYSLFEQRKDGAFYYWGNIDRADNERVDNYHTLFVLSSLFNIWQTTGHQLVRAAFERGLGFYFQHLLGNEFLPKNSPEKTYPLDIHSFAHAIIFFSKIDGLFPGNLERAKKIACWAIDNFQDKKEKFFYYQIREKKIDKTPYIRWAQAPMLNALSFLL
jgi:hypothetical protein